MSTRVEEIREHYRAIAAAGSSPHDWSLRTQAEAAEMAVCDALREAARSPEARREAALKMRLAAARVSAAAWVTADAVEVAEGLSDRIMEDTNGTEDG